MKKLFFKFILIFIIIIFIFELVGLILGSFKIIPRGSPAVISLFAHKKWSIWHPKNISFKHHYNTCWEPSKIYFNNIGARGKKNIFEEKQKKRIALIGDSMTEMIHVNEGEDIRSLIQKKLPDFEIINFSSRSMGLYDQLEIYKNLIKKYNVDYVILYITENDFENNFASSELSYVYNQPKFYIEKGTDKIKKIDRNYTRLENEYFSNYNNFKRSKLILYLKEYSYTFKIYFHIKTLLWSYKKTPKPLDLKSYNKKKNLFNNQKLVYEYLVELFVKELEKDKIKLVPIFNLRSYLFEGNNQLDLEDKIRLESFNIMRDVWYSYKPYFLVDEAKEYMSSNKNSIQKPFLYLGHTCDDHYSKFGSHFMSNETVKIFNNIRSD